MHQSHTIKHSFTKIVPKRHRVEHKGSTTQRSSTARRRKRLPMSNQSITSNTSRHIRQRQSTAQRMHWVTIDLECNYSMHKTASDRRWVRLRSETPLAKKTALLTILSSSSRCESADEHHTAEQYYKDRQDKAPKKISEREIDHEILVWTFLWYQTSELQLCSL